MQERLNLTDVNIAQVEYFSYQTIEHKLLSAAKMGLCVYQWTSFGDKNSNAEFNDKPLRWLMLSVNTCILLSATETNSLRQLAFPC